MLDLFMKMELPYEKKKQYIETLNTLYGRCVDNTITWEFIQTSLFLGTDILDVLIEQAGTVGEWIKENLAFQYVCIQLAQWEEEENGKDNIFEDD